MRIYPDSRSEPNNQGHLGACFYDRRRDAHNWFIEHFCARSSDEGNTWLNERVQSPAFGPYHAADDLLNPAYMGDYDVVTSDFTLKYAGFVDAFQVITARGDPNVVATKLFP